MNIVNGELVGEVMEYWNLFHSYIDLTSIFLWGLLGGIIGFILALILEIVFRKKILVKRRYKFIKYIACFYFIFFPFFSGFCFSQWFVLDRTQKEIVKNISTALGGSNTLLNKYLKDYIEEQIGKDNLKKTGNEGVDAIVDEVLAMTQYLQQDSDSLSSKTSQMISNVSNFLKSAQLKSSTKSQIAETLSDNFGIDKAVIEDLMDTELQSILETGAVNTYVEAQIKSIFGSLKFQILLIYLIGMLIPITEIILAHYLERKCRKNEMQGLEPSTDNRMDDRD